MCGVRLLPKADRQNGAAVSEKLIDRAGQGAGVLERVAMSGNARQVHRAMRAVTFAMGLNALRGDPCFALQRPQLNIRLFCLAAIASAQSRLLVKAALCSMNIDVYARVALLRAYEKEPGCFRPSTKLLSECDHAPAHQPPHLIFKGNATTGKKSRDGHSAPTAIRGLSCPQHWFGDPTCGCGDL